MTLEQQLKLQQDKANRSLYKCQQLESQLS